jgi:hypothetical protein
MGQVYWYDSLSILFNFNFALVWFIILIVSAPFPIFGIIILYLFSYLFRYFVIYFVIYLFIF